LTPPPADAARVGFDVGGLGAVRDHVGAMAAVAGLSADRRDDLVLAVHEVATNSIRHGGGAGEVLIWLGGDAVVCEVRDRGWIDDPLADRRAAAGDARCGRGLWMANQLCDLVQVRSSGAGTTVRVHQRRGGGVRGGPTG
jgi:anti-sigma regulatory factor (Ser/Thr protein kinase)